MIDKKNKKNVFGQCVTTTSTPSSHINRWGFHKFVRRKGCHKWVSKAKVVWRGHSLLRRYSRPRDLCRRVYLSSSHRSPLEEAFDAAQGMLKVASS